MNKIDENFSIVLDLFPNLFDKSIDNLVVSVLFKSALCVTLIPIKIEASPSFSVFKLGFKKNVSESIFELVAYKNERFITGTSLNKNNIQLKKVHSRTYYDTIDRTLNQLLKKILRLEISNKEEVAAWFGSKFYAKN